MDWGRYIPVAERREKALKKMKQLEKKGKKIEPIQVEGRSIVQMFWGKLWCNHIESFSDFENRLPRGRTYVRNGSVLHLCIKEGEVEALVCGSELYTVSIHIARLKKELWDSIKTRSAGQVGSLLELLKGQISDHVMRVVADHKEGLFPKNNEITFDCSCPDWAGMCKHVAAVLYGVGRRLDDRPELLFVLRGVDASELISTEALITSKSSATHSEDRLQGDALGELFGIELDDAPLDVEDITGMQLRQLRMKKKMSVIEFARMLQITPATIYRWEEAEGILKMRKDSKEKLKKFRD